MNTGEVLEDNFFEYKGKIARCDSGGGTTETVTQVTPSPLDVKKSEISEEMFRTLQPILQGYFSGQQPSGLPLQISQATQGIKRQAGKMGVEPGSPELSAMLEGMSERLSLPSDEITKSAIALFPSLLGVTGPGGETKTTQEMTPSMMQEFQGGFEMGLTAVLMYALLACWVAEELYGKYSLKTDFARYYCLKYNTRFIKLYRKYGIKWAKTLRNYPILKPIVRPIWDYMAWKGEQAWLIDTLHYTAQR